MKKFSISLALLALGSSVLLFPSCKGGGKTDESGKKAQNIVTARSMSDPDMLNPINLSSADGRYISALMHMTLLGTDPQTYEISPILVVARPTVSSIDTGEWAGGMRLDFEMRPEATWDNGSPVTADDYVFTLKTILNPKTNCQPLKSYYDWLADVVIDPTNNRKFTVFASEKYYKIEEFAGTYVLPEYVYDPEKIMRKFSIRDMNNDEKRSALKENADIQKFADLFNSEKFMRDLDGVIGCGPYKFTGWVTNQNITMERKKDWWGDKIKSRDFLAYPDKIIFKVIPDANTATTALKDGQIDAYSGIDPKQYEELLKNSSATDKINLSAPSIFAYSFVGFNLKNPKLSDIKVRQAIAHCINKDKINEVIAYNRSKPVETFVHPDQAHYNGDIKPWGYDLDKARKLLDEAGWKDSDGDGFRDKVLGGKKTKLSLEYLFPAANKSREQTGILLKEDFKAVGIELNIKGKEWAVYLQDMDNKNFEITYGAFTMSPTMSDPKQQWHTSAAVTGGSNSFSFGDAQSDKLIMDIRAELDQQKRIAMYKELQAMIHERIPCVFMFIPANRMGINKRYEVETTLIDPGYIYSEFQLVDQKGI